MPRIRNHRANQKPSRPASNAKAIRVIGRPAFTASSRDRWISCRQCLLVPIELLQRGRSIPGTIPATSQLDWLISTTTISVLSWQKGMRAGSNRSAGAMNSVEKWASNTQR